MKNKIEKNKKSKSQVHKIQDVSKGSSYFWLLIILLVSFASYYSLLQNGFVNWDDDDYIRNNALIRSIDLKKIFSENVMGNYHPLTILTFAIEYSIFGLKESGYHTISILIHLANVVMVFFAVRLLSDKAGVALITSLFFGIHPIHVESVAWAAEQKDLLYTFFFLASFICYLKYIKAKNGLYYFFSLLLFSLSLFSKAMAASLPVLLILTDYFKGRKINAKTLLEKIPFFALSILFGIIAVMAQKEGGAIQDIANFSFAQRLVFATYSFITYIITIAIPIDLSAVYPYPVKSGDSIPVQYYLYPIILIGLIGYVIYSLKYSKKIFFGIAFFLITVFLVLQLLPVGSAIKADRYVYIPSIGIFYLMAEGLILLWNLKYKTIVIGVLSVVSIFYVVQTSARCKVWKDSFTLWNDVISKYQTVPVAYNNRGYYFKNNKNFEAAMADYNKAIEISPTYFLSYNNRGNLFMNQNKNDLAIADYNKAIELKPDFVEAYSNRGYILYMQGKNEMALNDYNKAIELKPDFAAVYNNRGILYIKEKKYDEAIKDFTVAIGFKTDLSENYYNRGVAEYYSGKKEEGCKDWKIAIELGCKPAISQFESYCK